MEKAQGVKGDGYRVKQGEGRMLGSCRGVIGTDILKTTQVFLSHVTHRTGEL